MPFCFRPTASICGLNIGSRSTNEITASRAIAISGGCAHHDVHIPVSDKAPMPHHWYLTPASQPY